MEEETDTEVEEEDQVGVWAGLCKDTGVLEGPGHMRSEVLTVCCGVMERHGLVDMSGSLG